MTPQTQERIKADAREVYPVSWQYQERIGYIAGATAENSRAQAEINRRNKILEDDLKRQCRLNMPGISEQDQEAAWQAFKAKHNI